MALVDYDADSDEVEADDESVSSPKKQKPNISKLEKEEAASIVVETPGSESLHFLFFNFIFLIGIYSTYRTCAIITRSLYTF